MLSLLIRFCFLFVFRRWAYLHVETVNTFPDYAQAYAAGLAEGSITTELIRMHWTNTLAGYCPMPYSKYCAKLSIFLEQNLQWMKEQIKASKASSIRLAFWHQVSAGQRGHSMYSAVSELCSL